VAVATNTGGAGDDVIVLCGIPSEPPLRLAIDAAARAGIDHLVVNQRHASTWELRVVTGADGIGGALLVGGTEHDLASVTGVYVRLASPEELPEVRGYGRRPPDPQVAARVLAFHSLLAMWLEGASCRVANRLSAGGSNLSKPYQAQLIAAAGLAVPDTLVTNDPSAAARFAEDHGEVVFKSVSSVRSIVRRLDGDRRDQLERVRRLPTQFQRLIPGTDVRVHVVGDEVFATEIVSEAVDYRYAGRDGQDASFQEVDLPAHVAAACRRAAVALELPFCGIDLRRSPDGSYTCFEVNPSPGYSYYQAHTGQPIAEALVAWLAG
jgi:hypothetical protein